ncbi:hypothetical protein AXFE_33440 [Acidithrix ferrooxidans]|uniref:Uncharacterized protein n=2 Tax=Acidithrix ferrooxidans TaxID=1280514 RepID=A0A0D8HDA9_9ACTN|nr:hypothetical protein AXFE_33440 [Acidithrix ferrooxidans]
MVVGADMPVTVPGMSNFIKVNVYDSTPLEENHQGMKGDLNPKWTRINLDLVLYAVPVSFVPNHGDGDEATRMFVELVFVNGLKLLVHLAGGEEFVKEILEDLN